MSVEESLKWTLRVAWVTVGVRSAVAFSGPIPENRVPRWAAAMAWVLGVVTPLYAMVYAPTAAERWAAFGMFVFVLVLAVQVGRDHHPDRPAWKDHGPGFVRIMMRMDHGETEEPR